MVEGKLVVGIMPPTPSILSKIWSILVSHRKNIFDEHVNTYDKIELELLTSFHVESIKEPLLVPFYRALILRPKS